ncbi:unnamed protein product [Ceutorhynchus assimilis]|uniref:CHK kinase-like domain-containing protein n=1 Tax=Ceutorhynchus assimilis TaxID=467358 RepID=A0A9N9MI48_9CUCU|nr:unnamed protein product [Ceutorhynchus assimilis]
MDIDQKIHQWVCDIFKHENFKDIKVTITGSSEKGDGYVGDITFITANIVTSEGETKDLELVIKHGKLNDILRKVMPVRAAFEREIYLYAKIIPQLQKFLDEKNVELSSQFLPKCYGTLLYDNEEVIILENLKAQNYDLYNRYQPLNMDHLKLTLAIYGKWHALSFAYQDQNPEEANKLFGNLQDLMVTLLKAIDNYMTDIQEVFHTILQEKNEVELIEGIKKQIPDFHTTFCQLSSELENEKCVFLHGDCWNNNFMFQYDANKSKPEAVKFLDFQISNFRPPVFDLAYHIYSVTSEKELQHFDELLKIYHDSLSKTLKDLGSDTDSIYSYEDLKQQWKKFSSYGVMMASIVLPLALSSKEDTLDIGDMKEGSQTIKTAKRTLLTNGDKLTSRTIAFTKHYLDFLNK